MSAEGWRKKEFPGVFVGLYWLYKGIRVIT